LGERERKNFSKCDPTGESKLSRSNKSDSLVRKDDPPRSGAKQGRSPQSSRGPVAAAQLGFDHHHFTQPSYHSHTLFSIAPKKHESVNPARKLSLSSGHPIKDQSVMYPAFDIPVIRKGRLIFRNCTLQFGGR
jgi:hypothetical protein